MDLVPNHPYILAPMRFLSILCLLSTCVVVAKAQTTPGVYHDVITGLTMRFPVELKVLDAQKSIDEGHVAAFGSMQNEAKAHELAGRCMKPILLAEFPDSSSEESHKFGASTATLLMFEFVASKECKAGFKYKSLLQNPHPACRNGDFLLWPGIVRDTQRI